MAQSNRQHIFVHFIPMLFISLTLSVLLGLTALAVKPTQTEAYVLLAIVVGLLLGTFVSWIYDKRHLEEMPSIEA